MGWREWSRRCFTRRDLAAPRLRARPFLFKLIDLLRSPLVGERLSLIIPHWARGIRDDAIAKTYASETSRRAALEQRGPEQ